MKKLLIALALLSCCAFAQVTTNPSITGVPAPSSSVAITGGTISGVTISGSTYNGNTLTAGSSTYTGTAGQTYTFPTTSATIARTDAANTFTGIQSFAGNINMTGVVGGNRYYYTDETNTGTGKIIIQAGAGSAAYGGAINLYANANATHPGDVVAGISATSGGSFRVNSGGLDAGVDYLTVGVTGLVSSAKITGVSFAGSGGQIIISSTAPTIASGFGTSPSITANNTAAFRVTVGSAPGSTGVLTLPTATNGWACQASNITTNATLTVSQSAVSTTSVTLTSYSRTTGIAASFTASDVIAIMCLAY